MSNTETTPELEIDKSMPVQDASENGNSVVHEGKERSRSSFGQSLDKFTKKEPSADPKEEASAKEAPESNGGEKPDPIAAKAAAAKKEPKEEKQSAPAEEPKPERKSLKNLLDEKPKAKAEDKSNNESSDPKKAETTEVSEEEIEEELKNPHKSEKSQRRFRHLAKTVKELREKEVTTVKQLQEKESKLAELEKKLAEAGKAAGVPPEVQTQLDELAQYRRQYEVEKSPEYTKFDVAYKETEGEIAAILKSTGLKFQGMTQEQTIAFIEAEGGYAEFQRKNPKIAKQIREDLLDPAQNDDLTAAVARQKLLKKAQQSYVEGEKKQAKEYFAKIEEQRKQEQEAAAKAPKPEELAAKRASELDAWSKQAFTKYDFLAEEVVPDDASETVKKSISEKNAFAHALRASLLDNLSVKTEDEFKEVALAATLAHKIKRERDELAGRVEQLEAELKKVKSAGRTVTKSTQPAAAPSSEKPARSFSEALDRVEARKG